MFPSSRCNYRWNIGEIMPLSNFRATIACYLWNDPGRTFLWNFVPNMPQARQIDVKKNLTQDWIIGWELWTEFWQFCSINVYVLCFRVVDVIIGKILAKLCHSAISVPPLLATFETILGGRSYETLSPICHKPNRLMWKKNLTQDWIIGWELWTKSWQFCGINVHRGM